MAETRPTGEQLRFVSSATGEHILDTYLEAAERGGRTLPDLLSDLFDTSGNLESDNFQFRIDSSTRAYQVRVGVYANVNDGWTNIPNGFIFRQRGTFANATAYEQLDVVTLNNSSYVCTAAHTSSTATPDLTKFATLIDGSALNTATSSAQTSATNAANSATSAAASATTATTKASEASTSATNAAASASSATASATTATNQASSATTSATNAATSATNAAASATAAANSQSSASTSANAASASQTAAANSATSAASSASTATTQATNAANSASAASTSATNAAASASTATTQASNASASASAAATSATNAAASAASAASAQTAAEAARDQTLASFDSFDDRYLGPKANDPTLDNDGNALIAGALYFNTTAGAMKVYTGSAWVAAYVSGTSFLPLVGGTLTGALVLPGDAVNALEAVPKQQLDAGLATKAATSHTHAISDVTNLQSSLDAKAASTHSHNISDVTGLQTALDGKQAAGSYAAATHTHAISDVTNLQTTLDGKAATSHTHAIADVTGLQTALDGKQAAGSYAAATHTHAISDVTGLQTALDAKLATSGGTLTQVSQAIVAVAASAIDCSSGNYFTKTASGALTWTVTNVPSAKAYSFILELTNGGTGTQTWFSGIKWPGGTAPTLVASGVDVLGFITDDGGTTWRGVQLMKDSK